MRAPTAAVSANHYYVIDRHYNIVDEFHTVVLVFSD